MGSVSGLYDHNYCESGRVAEWMVTLSASGSPLCYVHSTLKSLHMLGNYWWSDSCKRLDSWLPPSPVTSINYSIFPGVVATVLPEISLHCYNGHEAELTVLQLWTNRFYMYMCPVSVTKLWLFKCSSGAGHTNLCFVQIRCSIVTSSICV